MYIAQRPDNCPDFNGSSTDWAAHNAGVTPEFFIETIKREDGTELEQECVILRVAGDDLTESCQPVDNQLRERFATEYSAWKAGTEAAVRGTPLSTWEVLSPRQVAALEALNIFTLENLAQLADGNIHNVFDGRVLRSKAIARLKQQSSNALADENAELRARLDALEKGQVPGNVKPPRAAMSQAQRDQISATMRARWQRSVQADAVSVPPKAEAPADGQEVLPVDLIAS